MDVSREKARKIVRAVLATLHERRPFKHDLANMEDKNPELWAEMMKVMEESVIVAVE